MELRFGFSNFFGLFRSFFSSSSSGPRLLLFLVALRKRARDRFDFEDWKSRPLPPPCVGRRPKIYLQKKGNLSNKGDMVTSD